MSSGTGPGLTLRLHRRVGHACGTSHVAKSISSSLGQGDLLPIADGQGSHSKHVDKLSKSSCNRSYYMPIDVRSRSSCESLNPASIPQIGTIHGILGSAPGIFAFSITARRAIVRRFGTRARGLMWTSVATCETASAHRTFDDGLASSNLGRFISNRWRATNTEMPYLRIAGRSCSRSAS